MASETLKRMADRFYLDPAIRDAVIAEVDAVGTGDLIVAGELTLPPERDAAAYFDFSDAEKERLRKEGRDNLVKSGLASVGTKSAVAKKKGKK